MPNQTTHFWFGEFDSKSLFEDFFKESFNKDDGIPISKFCASQNEWFIDHDFMEIGHEDSLWTFEEKFKDYSYFQYWKDEVISIIKQFNFDKINSIVMCNYDGNISLINKPIKIIDAGIHLEYIGAIKYIYENPEWLDEILDNK